MLGNYYFIFRNKGTHKNIQDTSKFFVIKGWNEEDIHKAIKYNLWTSTKNGNRILNDAFNSTNKLGGNVYLLFTCNESGKFLGVAMMKSEVDNDKLFPYWTQDRTWGGLFSIEWVFIKDVPFNNFKNIKIKMNDGNVRPISFARDCQEVPNEEGKQIIQIFEDFLNTNTILEHFEYYDFRQENYERMYPLLQQGIIQFYK